MGRTKVMSKALIVVLILLNVGCDQATKSIARTQLDYHEPVSIIQDRLTLIKVENYGAFLSSGDSLPAAFKFVLLSLLPLLVLLYGLYFLMSRERLDPLFVVGLSFVIGGGAGNLYDRFVHGSVTDFMHMDLFLFQTGVFNVADLSIMSGMCLILWNVYVRKISGFSTML
ncbi:signal peptidase II [Pedobacter sp. GR22-6]|uniref:signal peptidase II n=1 Tax=Pedobacter sp. GR22-6 TaxID=3127957 RepID=UPI00307DE936